MLIKYTFNIREEEIRFANSDRILVRHNYKDI